MSYLVYSKENPGKFPGADACGFHLFVCFFFLESETLYDVVRKTEGKRGLDSRSGLNYT